MLRRLTPKERLALYVETWEPTIRAAWIAAINSIRSSITLRLVVEAMERGDIGRALDALNIEREAFGGLETAIADAFNAGGIVTAEDMNLRDPEGHRVLFRFGVRDPESEAWLRNHSSALVTRITTEQIENARTLLSEGLARGDHPTRTALNLVGRVSRVSGQRSGGLIGLSAPHRGAVEKARSAMISGDVQGMRAYLDLETRDKRFDGAIRKAIAEGRAVPRDMVAKVTGRLSDKYLKLRGDTIALHETFTALSGSRHQAFRQAIASGKVDARDIVKTWRHTSQEHPRMQHVAMNGQTVAFDQSFIAPDGTMIPYPHAEGLPTGHTLGCKCRVDYRIDYTGALIRRRAN